MEQYFELDFRNDHVIVVDTDKEKENASKTNAMSGPMKPKSLETTMRLL